MFCNLLDAEANCIKSVLFTIELREKETRS